jgi:NAD(P)H-quinone oxidoreductase subunit 5
MARALAIPVLVLSSIAAYAAVYLGISTLLTGLPGVATPTSLSPIHAGTVLLFAAAYVAVERGWHRSFHGLYTWLVASSQPAASAVTSRRETYPS